MRQCCSAEELNVGIQLRTIRTRLGITSREVERISRQIAQHEENNDYVVSHARLIQIETGESTPSIYKIYSLSCIYSISISTLVGLYVNVPRIPGHHLAASLQNTHLLDFEGPDSGEMISFPVRFSRAFDGQNTVVLSQIVEEWGNIPVALLQMLNLRQGRWGYVGRADLTMFPILRPGSLVQIDDNQKPLMGFTPRNESERPIYFVELREGYVCSWCEVHRNRIVCVPHPLSPVSTREYRYPDEAEIVGRVVAVAARLVES